MKPIYLLAIAFVLTVSSVNAEEVVDFEDVALFTPGSGNGFFNGNIDGSNSSIGWTSGDVFFNNAYENFGSFDAWSGWSYSNVQDTTTAGFTNQYASFTGGGFTPPPEQPQGNYAVVYDAGAFGVEAFFNIPEGKSITSLQLTNTTYGALATRDGDVGPFGGVFPSAF